MVESERRRDTRQAAQFLTDLGFKTAPATLNKLRCVGGGPEFELWGRRPLYTDLSLLKWVQARTTPARRSTSDTAPEARSQPLSVPRISGDNHPWRTSFLAEIGVAERNEIPAVLDRYERWIAALSPAGQEDLLTAAQGAVRENANADP